jgi:hypothetical protein
MFGQIDKKLNLMQVDDLAVLNGFKAEETLKCSLSFLPLNIIFINPLQIIKLQMSTILASDWTLDEFLLSEKFFLAPEFVVEGYLLSLEDH